MIGESFFACSEYFAVQTNFNFLLSLFCFSRLTLCAFESLSLCCSKICVHLCRVPITALWLRKGFPLSVLRLFSKIIACQTPVFIGESRNSSVYVAQQHAFFKTCGKIAS